MMRPNLLHLLLLAISFHPSSTRAVTVWNNNNNGDPNWGNGLFLEVNPTEIGSLEKSGAEVFKSGQTGKVYIQVSKEDLEAQGMMDRSLPVSREDKLRIAKSEATKVYNGQTITPELRAKLLADPDSVDLRGPTVRDLVKQSENFTGGSSDGCVYTMPVFIGSDFQNLKPSCDPDNAADSGNAATGAAGDVCVKYPDLCMEAKSYKTERIGDADGSLAKKLGLQKMPSWSDSTGKDCLGEDGQVRECGDTPSAAASRSASNSKRAAGRPSADSMAGLPPSASDSADGGYSSGGAGGAAGEAGGTPDFAGDYKAMLLAKGPSTAGVPQIIGAGGAGWSPSDTGQLTPSEARKSGGSAWTADVSKIVTGASGGAGGGSPDALMKKAQLLLQGGDINEAITYLNRAVMLDPKNAEAFRLLAKALNKKKKHDKAEKAAEEAIRINRSNGEAYAEVTWSQLHLGKFVNALASADMAIRLDPDRAWSWVLKALALEQSGKREEMLKALEKAAELDPQYRFHLLRAREKLPLFDPSGDNEGLRSAFASAGKRRNPWVFLGIAGVVSLVLALVWWKFSYVLVPLKSRMEQELARRTAGQDKAVRALQADHLAMTRLKVGSYELVRAVGRGSWGALWEGYDPALERRAAIRKLNLPPGEQGLRLRALLLPFARELVDLRHPGIVDLMNVLDEPTGLYLVYEWVEGRTLRAILNEKRTLPLPKAAGVLSLVLQTLETPHTRGIPHRNLKPENILISPRGAPRLMDFGFAPGRESLYLAPEAAAGHIDARSDFYSLGLCFYEMLTGIRPFGDKPPHLGAAAGFEPASRRVPGEGLPVEADSLLTSLLAQRPEQRPARAAELLAVLKELSGEERASL